MQNQVPEKVLEEKIKKIVDSTLNLKKEEIYREMLIRLGIEERRTAVLERLTRVEEEIKKQHEIIEKLIHQFDKRFDQVDKRFEQVDKRFNLLTWFMGIGFTITISIILAVLSFLLR